MDSKDSEETKKLIKEASTGNAKGAGKPSPKHVPKGSKGVQQYQVSSSQNQKNAFQPDEEDDDNSEEENSAYDDEYENEAMESDEKMPNTIEIEGEDIKQTFQGMPEQLKLKFIQNVRQYISNQLKRVKGQDAGLFEKRSQNNAAKVAVFNSFNEKQDKFGSHYSEKLNFAALCDLLFDFLNYKTDKVIKNPQLLI